MARRTTAEAQDLGGEFGGVSGGWRDDVRRNVVAVARPAPPWTRAIVRRSRRGRRRARASARRRCGSPRRCSRVRTQAAGMAPRGSLGCDQRGEADGRRAASAVRQRAPAATDGGGRRAADGVQGRWRRVAAPATGRRPCGVGGGRRFPRRTLVAAVAAGGGGRVDGGDAARDDVVRARLKGSWYAVEVVREDADDASLVVRYCGEHTGEESAAKARGCGRRRRRRRRGGRRSWCAAMAASSGTRTAGGR